MKRFFLQCSIIWKSLVKEARVTLCTCACIFSVMSSPIIPSTCTCILFILSAFWLLYVVSYHWIFYLLLPNSSDGESIVTCQTLFMCVWSIMITILPLISIYIHMTQRLKAAAHILSSVYRIQHVGRAVHNITSQIWPFSLRVKIHARSCPLSEIGQTTTES